MPWLSRPGLAPALYVDMVGLDERLVERLAEAIHELYVLEQRADGVGMGQTATMTSWASLSEDARCANRDQARDVELKLELIGCELRDGPDGQPDFRFSPAEFELLARREQLRWSSERTASGWSLGPIRDDVAKQHPNLVAWEELSERDRDKDRDAVRNLLRAVRSAGLHVARR